MGGCHLFRHTVATLMLENGADIRVIQEMLGHAKLTTTELYTRVSINLLKQVYAATHPGAHLKRPDAPAKSAGRRRRGRTALYPRSRSRRGRRRIKPLFQRPPLDYSRTIKPCWRLKKKA